MQLDAVVVGLVDRLGERVRAARRMCRTVSVVFLLVARAILAPFVVLGAWLFMRFRRDRKDQAEALADDHQPRMRS